MTLMASNIEILILFKNNENNRKNLANNMSSIIKIDHQIYPLAPFEIFCPVLALTKVGSVKLNALNCELRNF
jgi:hypothetical protein